MSMKAETGRPQSMEGRQEREMRTYDLLDRLGIAYERVDLTALQIEMNVLQSMNTVKAFINAVHLQQFVLHDICPLSLITHILYILRQSISIA